MTHRPADPASQVATVLDPAQRAVLIEGRDGLPPRIPGRAFRGSHSTASWRALSPSERAATLDRLAPLGSNPDLLIARATAALGEEPAPSTPRPSTKTRTRTASPATAPAPTRAPSRARVLAPAAALHKAPTPPIGEAQAEGTVLQLTPAPAPMTGTVVPCAGCAGFVPARGHRPRLAFCSTACRPKPKGRRRRVAEADAARPLHGHV